MKKAVKVGDLFDDQDGDPLWEEALWRAREEEAGLPQKVARDWIAFSLLSFETVRPRAKSSAELTIMLLLTESVL